MLDMVRKTLSISQRSQFESFGAKINKFGVNFAVCNTADEVVLLCEGGTFNSNREQLIELNRQVLDEYNLCSLLLIIPLKCSGMFTQ